jgi:hypothetical protein
MNRNKPLSQTRPFVVYSAIMGLFRAIDEMAEEASAPKEVIAPETRAQRDDENEGFLLKFGICLILTLWAIVLVLYPLFTYFKYDRTGGRDPAKVLVYIPKPPPRPRSEGNPFISLKHFRAAEDAQLSTYHWIDRQHGVVSIPIERAIQILAHQGIPPSRPVTGNQYWRPRSASLLTGFEGKVVPER